MKVLVVAILSTLSLWSVCFAEGIETQGRQILEKSDAIYYPTEGSYDMYIVANSARGKQTIYKMQIYKAGRENQTAVWLEPSVMKNTVCIRNGDTIYYKPLKAFRPDIMSYQALFLDSGFSWGDIVSADIAADYKALAIDSATLDGKDCYLIRLGPGRSNRYSRIDVWIEKGTNYCLRRLYYSASGMEMKDAVFTVKEAGAAKVKAFQIVINDFLMKTKSTADITGIEVKKLPEFLFKVSDIGRIHAD